MTSDEFYSEWPRIALTWNKDPDNKLYRKIAAAWEKRLKRHSQQDLRVATDRLCAQDPAHFPTIGEVLREIATVNAAMKSKKGVEAMQQERPPTAYDYRQWAEGCAESEAHSQQQGRHDMACVYGELAAYYRKAAVATDNGDPVPQSDLAGILRRNLPGGLLRDMPRPEPQDWSDDGKEYY